MKSEYKVYRTDTAEIYNNLKPIDKKDVEKFRLFLSTTAGKNKVNQKIGFLVQYRDVLQRPLCRATKEDLIKVWGLLKVSDHAYNTKVMIRKTIKGFYRWKLGRAKSEEIFEDLKIGNFKVNEMNRNKKYCITPEELQAMLHRAESLRDKALLILLYELGCRPEEITKLKWSDINFDSREVHIFSNKTERCRDLPIEESIVHLKRWRQEWAYADVQDEDYVFPSVHRENHIKTEGLDKVVRTVANKAKITRQITPYTYRHSRLTEIYVKGVKGLEHNKFAGHKPGSKQQATYAHIDNHDMKEDVLRKIYHKKELTPEEKNELDALRKIVVNREEKYEKKDQDFELLKAQFKALQVQVMHNLKPVKGKINLKAEADMQMMEVMN